MLVSSITDTDT